MAKAVIVNVDMKVAGEWVVQYASGARRTYKGEAPKTVQAFLDNSDMYFKSAAAKTIFYLLEMSGEARTEFLGIHTGLYTDKEAARAWRNRMIKLVHPDNCSHPMAAKATEEVTRIYKRMTR